MTDIEEDEIDLSSLSDEELTEQMHDDLYDGMLDEICEGTNILLGRGWGPEKVLNKALVAGMTIVGIDFRDGILFVPEVLLAANAMRFLQAIFRNIFQMRQTKKFVSSADMPRMSGLCSSSASR
jgi:methanogenic corrinoid protein MtbC1